MFDKGNFNLRGGQLKNLPKEKTSLVFRSYRNDTAG